MGAKKAKHEPYLYELRRQEVDKVYRWQFKCPDCKDWTTIDELQFNGEKEIPCDCPEPKTINFVNLTKISRGVKYELADAPSEISR